MCGNTSNQWIGWVAVCQKRTNGEQHLRDGQCRRPVVLEDVQADHALAVDIAVIYPRSECDLRGFERILGREVNVQEEHTALVHGPGRSQDGGNPLVQVVPLGTGTAVWRWIQCDFGQLLLDPLGGRAECLRDLRIGLGFLGLWLGCGRGLRSGASTAVAVAATSVATAAASTATSITTGGSISGSATRTSTGRHLSLRSGFRWLEVSPTRLFQ